MLEKILLALICLLAVLPAAVVEDNVIGFRFQIDDSDWKTRDKTPLMAIYMKTDLLIPYHTFSFDISTAFFDKSFKNIAELKQYIEKSFSKSGRNAEFKITSVGRREVLEISGSTTKDASVKHPDQFYLVVHSFVFPHAQNKQYIATVTVTERIPVDKKASLSDSRDLLRRMVSRVQETAIDSKELNYLQANGQKMK